MTTALVLGMCCLVVAASASAVIPAEEKTQNLKMTTTELTEVCPGTLVDVKVAYETSNFDMATAISFKLQWNKEVFEIVEKTDTAKLKSCSLRYFDNQFHNEFEYISFLCASMTGQNVIPPKISKVMTATLRAKANLRPGHATISLIANPGLPGSGFKYLASAPLTVDINPTCSPEQIASAKGAGAARASRDSVMGSVESEAGAASGPGGMQWQMALGAVGIIAVVVLMLSRSRTRSAGDIQYAPL
jgi:hypothetical protein